MRNPKKTEKYRQRWHPILVIMHFRSCENITKVQILDSKYVLQHRVNFSTDYVNFSTAIWCKKCNFAPKRINRAIVCSYARYIAQRTLRPKRAYVNTEKSHTNNTMKQTLSVCNLSANMRIIRLLMDVRVWFLRSIRALCVVPLCTFSEWFAGTWNRCAIPSMRVRQGFDESTGKVKRDNDNNLNRQR